MVSLSQTVIKGMMTDQTILVGSEHGWNASMIWKRWLLQEQLASSGEPQAVNTSQSFHPLGHGQSNSVHSPLPPPCNVVECGRNACAGILRWQAGLWPTQVHLTQ